MDDNLEKWKILQNKIFEIRIKEAFELFRQNNIEPVLIKGWAAGLNYPNVYDRMFTDIDLAVSKEDFKRSLKLIDKNSTYIDLHKELRHLDTLEWNELFKNSRLMIIENYPIRILSFEDHLRVLCVHWLTDGGAYKEKLWDIYYAVDNRPNDFDWQKCLGVVSNKRKKWIFCAIKLAEKYLNLDLKNVPVEISSFKIPEWVIQTVEKEWSSSIKLRPLLASTGNSKTFFEQLKIRFPPNPIQATIDMNREFDEKSRRLIQMGNILLRSKNSLKRLIKKY